MMTCSRLPCTRTPYLRTQFIDYFCFSSNNDNNDKIGCNLCTQSVFLPYSILIFGGNRCATVLIFNFKMATFISSAKWQRIQET